MLKATIRCSSVTCFPCIGVHESKKNFRLHSRPHQFITIADFFKDVVLISTAAYIVIFPTHAQLRSGVVCNQPASRSVTIFCVTVCRYFCFSGKVCTRSGNPHRYRSVYADARTTNGITVLWCPTTAASDPPATLQMLVVRLVLSRLDFGNSVLVGITACLLCRLQSVMNAGARLIFQLRRSDHITDGLLSLHWL